MKIFYKIYITEDIFKSSNKYNNESLSELLAKALLAKLLKTSDEKILRGNPNLNEPDYVYNRQGYEVTLSMKEEIILKMKGKKPIDEDSLITEQQIITFIYEAVKRKSKKYYSVNTILFLINLIPNQKWDNNISLKYPTSMNDYEDSIYSMLLNNSQSNRNQFFKRLYDEFIISGIFEDILIAGITNDNRYIIYSINDFAKGQKFYSYFGINNNPNIPYCIPTHIDLEYEFSPIQHLYSIEYASRN